MMRHIAIVLSLQGVMIAGLLTVALDQYAHKRVESLGGVNTWGYRGPVARQKRTNEVRIGMIGGSLAFGWGVAASESLPSELRRLAALVLDVPGRPAVTVTGINVAALGLPPSGFAERARRFADLQIDVLCMYPDPVGYANGQYLPAAESAITALTGYVPMLPLVLEERGRAFSVVAYALRRGDALLYRLVGGRTAAPGSDDFELVAAVRSTLAIVPAIVVVLPSPAVGTVSTGFESVPDLLRRHGRERLRIVDLSRDPVLQDPRWRLDQLNFGAAGHARAAEQIAPAVLELLASE